MAELFTSTTIATIIASLILLLLVPTSYSSPFITYGSRDSPIPESDIDLLEFPLNLEYLEAEFFLYGSMGQGLDSFAPNLTMGGPRPLGAKKANLDPYTRDIIKQFAWQEVGHLRDFPRPLLDLSTKSFAKTMDAAFGKRLSPPFDPYASSLHYLIASYVIPYVGLTGYVGANPKLQAAASKRLVAGLLAVESGQDAVIRGLLYEHALIRLHPYGITVAEFTNRISDLRNKLGQEGVKDEGLVVPEKLGAEGRVRGNVIAGDEYSVGYARTPEEILRIVYSSGNESTPGGFYPKGADGRIAKKYLQHS
ncbi:hypothetical protein OIU76_013629 [Salix suchowensis]|nr:hypothetical protein OIU76_013629 [Salix suchowensis]